MKRSGSSVLAGLKNVPPFPPVAVKLLALLSKSSVEVRQVADLVGTDATFTARLLQRVNSIELGMSRTVSDIKQAVALLGIDQTRQIIVTYAIKHYSTEGVRTKELQRCWQHMVATAVLAEVVAQACGEFANVAFTAGIIHDIGRLGLLIAYPQEYERVMYTSAERCLDILDHEAEEFGLHHAEAGRILAELWGLPDDFARITGRHHDPCEGTELDLLRIVHVACRLADVLGYDFVRPLKPVDSDTVLAELPASAIERLRIPAEGLRRRIEERIREFDGSGTDVPPDESLQLLASSAQEGSQSASGTDASDAEAQKPSGPVLEDEQASPPEKNLAPAIVAGALVIAAAAAFLIWKVM